jgi:hypothetical protein
MCGDGVRLVAMFDSLPRELLQLILSHLEEEELKKIDMAILSHRLRPSFLAAMDGLVLMDGYVQKETISWFLLRKIRFTYLELVDFDQTVVFNSRDTLECLDWEKVTDENISVIGPCPRLTSLVISCSLLTKTEFLAQFFSLNPQILSVSVSNFGHLDVNLLSVIRQYLPNLENLCLWHCQEVTDNYLAHLVPGCPKLVSLTLSGTKITDTSLRLILDNFPNLRSLVFKDCNNVSYEMLKLCILRFPIAALLIDNEEVQTQALQDLTEMLEYLGAALVSVLSPSF